MQYNGLSSVLRSVTEEFPKADFRLKAGMSLNSSATPPISRAVYSGLTAPSLHDLQALARSFARDHFNQHPLRRLDEGDFDARGEAHWLYSELSAFAFQVGRRGVEVVYRQADMLQAEVRRLRRVA